MSKNMDKFSEVFETPMMVQYMELKERYPNCILFFRLGDFYEMFLEDAKLGSEVLGITLTHRSRGKDGKIPMAGVPYHAVSNYLNKLVSAGYKVAICEQLSDPSAKGLVERDVVRVVTPGTITDETSLDKKTNNFLATLYFNDTGLALAAADLTTGVIWVKKISREKYEPLLAAELAKLNPSEVILSQELYDEPSLLSFLSQNNVKNIFPITLPSEKTSYFSDLLEKCFKVKTLASFGFADDSIEVIAVGVLVYYLQFTQKGDLGHFHSIKNHSDPTYLALDRSSIINLELLKTLRDNEKLGSLINHLDFTITAMGGRKLKTWLLHPLLSQKDINARLDVVESYFLNRRKRTQLRDILHNIRDIERIVSRISLGYGNPRDLINLSSSLTDAVALSSHLDMVNSLEATVRKGLRSKGLEAVISKVTSTIVEEPPIDPKQGGVIKENISLELDTLNEKIARSRDWIARLEQTEKEQTGISSLKVKFNKVFGFYIEVSKSNLHLVPAHFDRKQTLVNAERFTTNELKKHEEIILTAEEKTNTLEHSIFLEVCEFVVSHMGTLQESADCIATLDCLLAFAEAAEANNYTRPTFNEDGLLKIDSGRHPVVECLLKDYEFVPNDTELDSSANQMWLITGPNMAGKSVYIRQVALIVLMAQMGSFVSASFANISIVDKIFVRSGASDVITSGLSTFMVEMVETAYILNNATSRSLIVMDEIGRGTSTFDGISIAWSVAEYLVSNQSNIFPKTLFATHYHELEGLEKSFPSKVKNYQMAIEASEGDPVFLHKLVSGGAGHSYGVVVAKLAGVPSVVLERAYELLEKLESGEHIV